MSHINLHHRTDRRIQTGRRTYMPNTATRPAEYSNRTDRQIRPRTERRTRAQPTTRPAKYAHGSTKDVPAVKSVARRKSRRIHPRTDRRRPCPTEDIPVVQSAAHHKASTAGSSTPQDVDRPKTLDDRFKTPAIKHSPLSDSHTYITAPNFQGW